jgi:hypothetical protein
MFNPSFRESVFVEIQLSVDSMLNLEELAFRVNTEIYGKSSSYLSISRASKFYLIASSAFGKIHLSV